jgi:hypothetical protein
MSELTPFIKYFVEESSKKRSLAELLDSDINKACYEIQDTPENITPRIFNQTLQFQYTEPEILYVYPSKEDVNDYLLKSEQLVESLHGLSKQAVFEIRGNKELIQISFFAEKTDIAVINSAVRNFYPNAITETGKVQQISAGDLFIYDFIPIAPFYKAFTTYHNFTVSPLNIISHLFFNIENNTGAFQIIFTPLPGGCHELVKDAIDTEWKALQGTDQQVPPSLQPGAANKKLEYKSPDFKSYFSVCFRLILPTGSLEQSVRAFISNYSYGNSSLKLLDNQDYSQEQIKEMLEKRVSYHTGFLLNSHELTSILHVPYQVLFDKTFNNIIASAPVGDTPFKSTRYKDVAIGFWACGNSSKEVHLPIQREIPHVHVLGVSRSGKSVLLSHIAIEKLKNGEAVFILDPHGDLVDNTLKMVPEELMEKVIVIDFGLNDLTPQLTIRGNVDITNPSKVSDDLTESMRDVASTREFWGPRMAYAFMCLYYIYSVLPDLNFAHIRQLASPSRKAKSLRTKVRAQITHPIVCDFLDEIDSTPFEIMMPVITRLSHLLLDEKSLRLFTLDENKISINDIMENGKLCLVNLSCGIIGKQRSSILSGLMDSLINNNALARAAIPYEKRKPCTIIKDEFYLGPGDLDSQITGLAKYNLAVIFAHQYLNQVEGRTQEVMATAGTRIIFKLRRKDAETIGMDFDINPLELTELKKFQAIAKIEDEVIKINTPKPTFAVEDYSREIMENCLQKYYLRHKDALADRQVLPFDTL